MSARTAISLEEYWHTSFAGVDLEYRDGALRERAAPDYLHGRTQLRLGAFFLAREHELQVYASSEMRLRLDDRRVLIPDVSVFFPTPPDGLPDLRPLIVIEILSPDDRMSEVREKLEEYCNWGVPHVWLVDPRLRLFYTGDSGLNEVRALKVASPALEVRAEDVFG